MTLMNQKIVLVKRPAGEVRPSDFQLVETAVPELQEGEVLFKTKYFSLDPYMRARMNEFISYSEPFQLGEVVYGAAICTVEASKNPDFKVGDIVLTMSGWQKYAVFKPQITKNIPEVINGVLKLPPDVKHSLFLGILGMPGLTAFYGLYDIGQPKAGETVVVAAATGPVGSMVGQLAKAKGCHVVGVAGGAEKCLYAVEKLGFDVCIDHKSKSFAKELATACPKGCDIYFELVGGNVFKTVFPLLNLHARVPVCGAIAWYNDAATLREKRTTLRNVFSKISAFFRLFFHLDRTPLFFFTTLGRRIKFQGFIIQDNFDDYERFVKEAIPLVQSGKIKYKEDIVHGIENAPDTFIKLIKGQNFGKTIIEIS